VAEACEAGKAEMRSGSDTAPISRASFTLAVQMLLAATPGAQYPLGSHRAFRSMEAGLGGEGYSRAIRCGIECGAATEKLLTCRIGKLPEARQALERLIK
jgi:hypothetical protein